MSSLIRFITNSCVLVGARLISVVKKQTDRLDIATKRIATIAVRDQTKGEILQHFSADLAAQKASISVILNAFKSEIFKARYACLEAIGKRRDSPVQLPSESIGSIFTSPVDPRRNVTYPGRRQLFTPEKRLNKGMQLLAAGCDEIGRSILQQLGIEETIQPTIELVHNPSEFGRQITRICGINQQRIDEMREEIENLRKELAQVRTTLSPQVSEVLKRMLSAITGLSHQLQTEHESLIQRLT
jgi:hypothetical protein